MAHGVLDPHAGVERNNAGLEVRKEALKRINQ
jgi:hypothetical protein